MLTNSLGVAALAVAFSSSALAQWVEFVQDDSRIDAPPEVVLDDLEEKDYAWADLDQDGDIDLVIVRKEPWLTEGGRTNVLLMNEDGVLTDRTTEFATASNVPGDLGFATPTNDRDVVLVDLNGDSWLDIVTAPTLSDYLPKHISHPRVYISLGTDVEGNFLGFRFEDDRIPIMHLFAGPRFCSVAAGDVTGDGAADLYFGDYDETPFGPPLLFDYNNRLLINDGNGYFTDQTTQRLSFEMYDSAFGTASVIADMNGDGVMDVVKQTSLQVPTHVAITYNDPGQVGVFDRYDVIDQNAPYFVNVGDLNNDGKLDLVVTDDAFDRVYFQTDIDGFGQSNFSFITLPPTTDDFGGNSVIADLDRDGWNDILISDVDVEVPGCSRFSDILHNLGTHGDEGTPVQFDGSTQVIPDAMNQGVHDYAVFDIDGDQWLDLVVGRCSGTEVWINVPPFGTLFSYPDALPEYVDPQSPHVLTVELIPFGGAVVVSATMHFSINGGAFTSVAMSDLGDGFHRASLPATDCGDRLEFYFEAEASEGSTFLDPPTAPASTYAALATFGVSVTFQDEIEGDVSAWTVDSVDLVNGEWEQADPNATSFLGEFASPEDDATPGDGTMAFVTQNGPPNGFFSEDDVDGGPTRLTSPVIDLGDGDALIGYHALQFTEGSASHVPDPLTVEVSNDDGSTWVAVPEVTTFGTGGAWLAFSFQVSRYVAPTPEVRVRFTSSDQPNNSVTESGVDSFIVQQLLCDPPPCPADLNNDGTVGVEDLITVVLDWGCTSPPGKCDGDWNGDGVVDVLDLVELMLAWGDCSG